jgi:hypothetical protein
MNQVVRAVFNGNQESKVNAIRRYKLRIRTFLAGLLLVTSISGFAQVDRIDSLLNDLVFNESDPLIIPKKTVKYDFLYSGVNFSSKTFYAGREIGDNMYNISGHLFYYNSSGLFMGASGRWYDQLTPGYTTTTLSVGYSKALDKNKLFRFRTMYSRFLYNDPESLSTYPDKNNFSLGLSFRKKWIGARISVNSLFGEDFRINLSTAIYSRFTLVKLGKYNKIYAAPEVSLFLGTETILLSPSAYQSMLKLPGNEKDVFGLLNTQFYVPVGISLGNFDVEFSASLNIPGTQDNTVSYPVTFYYAVSLGYMLPIVRN